MLSAKNLGMQYQDGEGKRTIFQNVNIEIKEEERVAIVGPSGSGKSTLLYLLSGLRKPTEGSVSFEHSVITDLQDSSKVRMQHFGFVFQQHYLIPYLSVLQNVLIGESGKREKKKVDKAKSILCQLGLEKEMQKKPFQLSGGQQQRVAIARAVVKNPKIIFADEPTASLDRKNAVEVMELLRGFTKAALIFNTHDLHLIKETDRIIEISENGAVPKAFSELGIRG